MHFIVCIQKLIFRSFDIMNYIAVLLNQKTFTFPTTPRLASYLKYLMQKETHTHGFSYTTVSLTDSESCIRRTMHDRLLENNTIAVALAQAKETTITRRLVCR